jgi:hypothetical protein
MMNTSDARPIPLVRLAFLVTVQMLAYGVFDDLVDEYIRMREPTCLGSVQVLQSYGLGVCGIILVKTKCCRYSPVVESNALRGLPEMFGSIDCMHWE